MEKRKSIILVTVDCLRADHVGFMGYVRPTTPFLDSLAQDSFVIPTAIVAGAPTYYSLPAILASRYPLALGRDVLGIGPDEPTLASVLREAGYRTAAFGAANPYISPRFGYDHGFDTFRDFLESEPAPLVAKNVELQIGQGWASRLNHHLQRMRPAMGPLGPLYDEGYFRYCQHVTPVPDSLDALRRFPAADQIVEHACEWLASAGNAPFFAWLHLMDPHSPYYPRAEALASMGDHPVAPFEARYLNCYWNRSDLKPRRLARRGDEIVRLYDGGIRWVDGQIAQLVRKLRAANIWDDCIFALTADHGEEFLDHGGRYHPPSRLMEELIHVPLLLRIPGATKNDVSKAPFSLLHLAPTLLEAASVPAPGEFRGRSYCRQLGKGAEFDSVAVSECVAGCTNPFSPFNRMGPRVLSVRESRFKLMLYFDPQGDVLYDLDADPHEQKPLATTEHRAERRRLLEIAREHLARSYGDRDWKAQVRARLRDHRLEWTDSTPKISAAAS